MDESFQISAPKAVITGDYLAFTITDGEKQIPASISRTALATLAQGKPHNDLAVFEAHSERIRRAAFEMRRVNSTLDVVKLGSHNF
ncbi:MULTISPECIES: DUF1488 family protein [Ralstonia solanacearum species complex]|uniref:DUF1488 domain-containing protein n=2 Tax=Ralstonia solanacearum TaxID=305 RepID=A0ABF7RDD1_RALSL|nr:DUF1488 family protein [Ralstonia solanacearum]ALF88550.1 hypothetical protein RSUY_22230 [Ralstonia solanacearum]ATI27996.1 hypothetical protein CCY86_11140 [Ralstonia solanacearum]ATJ86754.1 hypothetical protein CDC59_11065 [Ralstonia solanacearum]KEI32474.1 hypothetical protein CQ06_16615 [Ralstonia solanacearum]KFX78041.1 hypothetical protein KR98_15855 [Ralstonia solanacearum]